MVGAIRQGFKRGFTFLPLPLQQQQLGVKNLVKNLLKNLVKKIESKESFEESFEEC